MDGLELHFSFKETYEILIFMEGLLMNQSFEEPERGASVMYLLHFRHSDLWKDSATSVQRIFALLGSKPLNKLKRFGYSQDYFALYPSPPILNKWEIFYQITDSIWFLTIVFLVEIKQQ